MDPAEASHWDSVYSRKRHESLSWFQPHPALSMEMIANAVDPPASVLDVGSGASYLADRLLESGYRVGVMDISEEPLRIVRERLGLRQSEVEWLACDVRAFRSARPWDVWHDRAVFHFLVDSADRIRYRAALHSATRPGSAIIIAAFGPDGPERCSGLPIRRYSPEELAEELGPAYRLDEVRWDDHGTPSGALQQFVYCRFTRLT